MDLLYGLYQNKLLGLMFINALTMESIGDPDQDDDRALKEMFDSSQLSGQFDAKMKLALMSRRPFSQMYHAIGGELALKALIEKIKEVYPNTPLNTNSSYADVFRFVMMSENNEGKDAIKSFGKADYGEQYHSKNGLPLRLSSFKDWISKDLRVGQDKAFRSAYTEGLISCTVNELYIDGLLNNGIVTTTMLRNLSVDPTLLRRYFRDDYYVDVLNSISDPLKYKNRIVLSMRDECIVFSRIFHPYDLLSPPVFLDESSDSMGYYRDEKYGDSALIEVRGICNIGDFFIRLIGLKPDKVKGKFLREVSDLSSHAVALLHGLEILESQFHNSDAIGGMLCCFADKDRGKDESILFNM